MQVIWFWFWCCLISGGSGVAFGNFLEIGPHLLGIVLWCWVESSPEYCNLLRIVLIESIDRLQCTRMSLARLTVSFPCNWIPNQEKALLEYLSSMIQKFRRIKDFADVARRARAGLSSINTKFWCWFETTSEMLFWWISFCSLSGRNIEETEQQFLLGSGHDNHD